MGMIDGVVKEDGMKERRWVARRCKKQKRHRGAAQTIFTRTFKNHFYVFSKNAPSILHGDHFFTILSRFLNLAKPAALPITVLDDI